MLALSIKQPWAYAILELGKDIENRKWKLPNRYRGYRHWIHAGKSWDKNAPKEILEEWQKACRRGHPAAQLGGLVGSVEFTKCLDDSHSPTSKWFQGPYGFVCCEPRTLLKFIPCKGQLRFFKPEVKDDI
jgi:hypothetical protein